MGVEESILKCFLQLNNLLYMNKTILIIRRVRSKINQGIIVMELYRKCFKGRMKKINGNVLINLKEMYSYNLPQDLDDVL